MIYTYLQFSVYSQVHIITGNWGTFFAYFHDMTYIVNKHGTAALGTSKCGFHILFYSASSYAVINSIIGV